MNFAQPVSGLVLLCDDQGAVQQVLHDKIDGIEALVLGRPLTQIVEPGNLEKMLNFLVELRAQGAAFDWELNVVLAGQVTTLHFTGVTANSQLLIIGSQSSQGVTQLYEEIMRMNNEQVNTLRTVTKDQVEAHRNRNTDLYDELSRLNNQLVTLQRELVKKNAELERLNTQKNQFLGMASHDLRAPLGVIISYSEFLLDETASYLSNEHLEFLTIIRSSSEFMLSLVNDLLDVSAIEAGKLELDSQPVDLVALVKSNLALNKVLAARKQIELEFYSEAELPQVVADRHKIEQVLNNLLSNAVKFSYPRSQVIVQVVRIGEQVVISVSDTGQGIPSDELDKLFKPFARTSIKSTGGEKSTGLGLMIARKVIEAHNGHIGVESTVGQGSTFYFTLPLVEMPLLTTDPGLPTTDTRANLAKRPLRILLADDSSINQKITLRLLETAGYPADVVSDGQAVCEALQSEAYDLILMDLHMPVMDGLAATRFIRQSLPKDQQPYIIAITASAWSEDIQKCLAAGMNDSISKPIRLETLTQKIHQFQSLNLNDNREVLAEIKSDPRLKPWL